MQHASLADCQELISDRTLADLPPLLREALLLRLSELDPARLAALLLADDGGNFESWNDWIGWLSQAHPALLKEQMAGGTLSITRREAAESAILQAAHCSKIDPGVQLDRILRTGGHADRIPAALQRLAEDDPHLALDYLSRVLKEGLAFFSEDKRFLIRLAETDPVRFQSLLGLAKTPELQMSLAGSLARVLARDDPAAALELHASMPPSRARSIAALEIARIWGKRDPEAALAWVQSALPEGTGRRVALAAVLRSIAGSKPVRVLELLGPADVDSYGFNGYLTASGSQPIGRDKQDGVDSVVAVRERAILALVARDPEAALQHLEQEAALLSTGPQRYATLIHHKALQAKAAAAWLAQDPAAAVAWIDTLDPKKRGFLDDAGWTGTLETLTPARAVESLQAAARMTDGEVAGTVIRSLLPVLVTIDPAAALRVTDDLPDHLRTSWLSDVISRLSAIDPLAAAREIERLPVGSRSEAHGKVAAGIASTSPERAVSYLETLPPEQTTAEAYRISVRAWSAGQWQDALAWWRELPAEPSTARDGALAAIASRLYREDPSSAAALVQQIATISDQALRLTALESLVETMAKSDYEAAVNLARQPGMELPEYSTEKLLQSAEFAREFTDP